MPNSITHNLGRLTDFRGRDTRGQFWLWAACVVAGAALIWCVALCMAAGMSAQKVSTYIDAHPELTTVTRRGNTTYRALEGSHPELFSAFHVLVWATAAITLVAVWLLAASVARRLHDRGRSAFWGLAPLPFLVFGLTAVDALMRQIMAGPSVVVAWWFLAIFLNSIVYLGVLLTLVIQLSGAGRVEPDRFGAPVG